MEVKSINQLTQEERVKFITYKRKNGFYDETFLFGPAFDNGETYFVLIEEDVKGCFGIVVSEVETKSQLFVIDVDASMGLIDTQLRSVKKKYPVEEVFIGVKNDLPKPYEYQFQSLHLQYIGPQVKEKLDIIPLDKDNVDLFKKIHNDAFLLVPNGGSITEEELLLYIEKEVESYIVYDKEAIGIMIIKDYIIDSIAVLPKYQGRGYGRKILRKCIELMNGNVELFVVDANKNALELYYKNDFIVKEYKNKWYKKRD